MEGMKIAILKYSNDSHTNEVILKNRKGHSFSAKSEELSDFISYEDDFNNEITKEALLERGFKSQYGQMYYLKIGDINIGTRGLYPSGNVVIFTGIYNQTKAVPLPNCRTLTQLDALIEMFKT